MEPQMVVRIMANIDGLKEALAQGGSAIQNTTAGMQRMVASFSGDKLIQQAVNMAAAIDKIGGASKLTEAELARANAVFERAAEKMTALGSEGAAAMQKLAESTRAVAPPMQQAEAATVSWGQSFSSVLAGFLSAQAIWSTVTAGLNLIVSALGAVKDALIGAVLGTAALGDEMLVLANKTGISVERLSAWRYVAGQTGTSLEQITGSIFKLQNELGEGGKKTAQALNAIGLSVQQLRAQRPDEAFESVLSKLKQLPSESDKAAVGVALFGKGFKDMANLTRENIDEMMGRFQDLGGTISTEMAVAGDAFNDARADWGVLVERINTSIGAAILPAATAFVNIMVDAVKKTLDESGVSAAQFQASISNAFSAVVDVSGLVLQAIGLLIQGFAELFTGKWTQETAGLVSAIGLVGTNISGLGQTVALFNGQAGLAGMFEKLKAGFVETMRISTQVAIAGRESERVLVALGQNMAVVGEQIKGKGAAALEAVRAQIKAASEEMRNAAATAGGGVGLFTEAVAQMGRQIDFSDAKLQQLIIRIQAVTLPLARLREGGIETSRSFTDLNRTLGVEMDAAMRRATIASQAATERMTQYRNGAQEATQTTSSLGTALDIAADMAGAFASSLGSLGRSLAGIIGIVADFAYEMRKAGEATTELAQKQQKAAAMNQLAMSGWMAAIAIGQMSAASLAAQVAQQEALENEVRELTEALEDQFGSWDDVAAAAARYGIELDGIINRTRELNRAEVMAMTEEERNRYARRFMPGARIDTVKLEQEKAALEEFQRLLEQLERDVQRYELTWADLAAPEDRLRGATESANELLEAIKRLSDTGFSGEAIIGGMAEDLNEWLETALRAGTQIPAAMQPVLESLIRMGQLSDENAAALLGLDATIPTLDEIAAAAERYGIELEDLGSKVQQLQIEDAGLGLLEDWNVLSRATDDLGVVFEAMGEDVNELVQDAMRYGAELPAAMRPMIQAFIDSGELVDETGQKITDISQISFGENLTEQVDRLVDALYALITAMGGVAPAAAAAFNVQPITDATNAVGDFTTDMSAGFAEMGREVELVVDGVATKLELLQDPFENGEAINIIAVDEASGVIDQVKESLDQLPPEVNVRVNVREAERAGFKTRAELEEIAETAERIYESMRRSGEFTQGEITRAFRAWQEALEKIDPSPLGRIAAAGYKTRDELQAAANDAREIWQAMVDSGRFTADEIQRAWEDWQDKLAATGADGMTRAVREELEKLKAYVASELPEFDEFGNRIFGVEEQRAIDRIAEIEAQVAESQRAMGEATQMAEGQIEEGSGEITGALSEVEGVSEETFQAMEDSVTDAKQKMRDLMGAANDIQTLLDDSDYGEAFRNAKDDVEDLIDAINRIPGWSGDGGSGGMADYAYRTASSDTLGPSVAYRTAPMSSSDSRIVASLDRIGRQLTNQQPDIMIVPMVTGNVDEFESRMAEAMPRRVTRSANLRNAWQRAVNGAAGG